MLFRNLVLAKLFFIHSKQMTLNQIEWFFYNDGLNSQESLRWKSFNENCEVVLVLESGNGR